MPYKCLHDGCNGQLLPDKSKTEKIGKVAITLYRCEDCGLALWIGTDKVIYKNNEPWGMIRVPQQMARIVSGGSRRR